MADRSIKDELMEEMEGLSEADLRRVLDFARSLGRGIPKGTPGAALLRFAGTIPPDEMDRIAAAIEEECEQINPDGW